METINIDGNVYNKAQVEKVDEFDISTYSESKKLYEFQNNYATYFAAQKGKSMNFDVINIPNSIDYKEGYEIMTNFLFDRFNRLPLSDKEHIRIHLFSAIDEK